MIIQLAASLFLLEDLIERRRNAAAIIIQKVQMTIDFVYPHSNLLTVVTNQAYRRFKNRKKYLILRYKCYEVILFCKCSRTGLIFAVIRSLLTRKSDVVTQSDANTGETTLIFGTIILSKASCGSLGSNVHHAFKLSNMLILKIHLVNCSQTFEYQPGGNSFRRQEQGMIK